MLKMQDQKIALIHTRVAVRFWKRRAKGRPWGNPLLRKDFTLTQRL